MQALTFEVLNDEIAAEAKRIAAIAGRNTGNFEDQIRVANELLRGLEIISLTKADDAPERKHVLALAKWSDQRAQIILWIDPGGGTKPRVGGC